MIFKNKEKKFKINNQNYEKLQEDELKMVFGSGNSQIRFIPDEYLQTKILGMKMGG